MLRVDISSRQLIGNVCLELLDEAKGQRIWSRIKMEPCEKGYCVRIGTDGDPRVVFYRFYIETDFGDVIYGAREDGLSTSGSAIVYEGGSVAGSSNEIASFQLTIFDPSFSTPEWFNRATMYQIFPDRFARGEGGIRREGVKSHLDRDWPIQLHEGWDESLLWEEPYEPIDFYGGTFKGIKEKLDYIASLGVNVIYLNPVWEARSNHRYDTGDYELIDPILGDADALERLVEAANQRGIRVILDAVLSHTGSSSKYFNKDGSYESLGAYQSVDSPYRSWYDFGSFGDVGYRSWWGDPTLPEVNEGDASWQAYMLGSSDVRGVVGGWISRGCSGVRLDVADEIPDEVLERIRTAVKNSRDDAIVIGEVWEDATTKESYGVRRTYALGRSLDSVMNYPLRSALIRFANADIDARQLETFLKTQQSNYPDPFYKSLMNLLSSHDVERIRSVLALGTEFRQRPRDEQVSMVCSIDELLDARGSIFQAMLAAIIYTLPGVPCLYYGDERGMQGGRDPFDRATFPWDVSGRRDVGRDLTDIYKILGALRKDCPAIRDGEAAFFSHGKDIICVIRVCVDGLSSEAIACVVNRSDKPAKFAVDLIDERSGLNVDACNMLRGVRRDIRCLFSTQDYLTQDQRTFVSDGSKGFRSKSDNASNLCQATCEDGIFLCEVAPTSASIYRFEPRTGALAKRPETGLGVICHITSVPVPAAFDASINEHLGTLGAPSMRFVDELADAGVKYWQILPLNPTDAYGSPYAGLSAFAGNTALLDAEDISMLTEDELHEYADKNENWLIPYATFKAIKRAFGEIPWYEWPEEYRSFSPGLSQDPKLAGFVCEEIALQCRFDKQWTALRDYANSRGVTIIGDMPIYVSADSADVWAHPELFSLDESGRVKLQGGVPPDQFAPKGQNWANPTYDWQELRKQGYDWWLERFERMFNWYDYVRIDHFLGFANYFTIPAGASAQDGTWMKGPGLDLFECAYKQFGRLPIIAEDLGIITDDVRELLHDVGACGMEVIQFADNDPRYGWSPAPQKIAYMSTHDTPTLLGWICARYGTSGEDALNIMHDLERTALSAPSKMTMMLLQDVLELGDEARMNTPGIKDGNWKWQACKLDLDCHLARLGELVRMSSVS